MRTNLPKNAGLGFDMFHCTVQQSNISVYTVFISSINKATIVVVEMYTVKWTSMYIPFSHVLIFDVVLMFIRPPVTV